MKIADLFILLGLKKDGFDKGIDDAKQKTTAFGSSMKKLGGMIAGVFAADKIISFGRELYSIAMKAEGIQTAFSKISDIKMLDSLKKSVHGTVSELELMQRVVQANNFGIPVQDLAKLFAFATKRAQDTGQSVDYLVDSIVIGLGRKSPLILDNLGISIVELRKRMGGMSAETASVAELAKVVGDIASDSFKKTGDIIETMGIKSQRLSASWANMKTQMSTMFSNAEWLKNDLDDWSKLMEIWQKKEVSRWHKFISSLSGVQMNKVYSDMKKDESIRAGLEQKESSGGPLEMPNKKGGKTIKDIEDENSSLKEQLQLTQANDTATIKYITGKMAANDKLLAQIKDLSTTENAYAKAQEEIAKKQKELSQLPKQTIAYYEAEISLLQSKQKLITDPQLLEQSQAELRLKQSILDELTKEIALLERKEAKLDDIKKIVADNINPNDKGPIDTSKLVISKGMQSDLDNFDQSSDAFQQKIDDAKAFTQEFNSILADGMAEAITTMAEGFGELAADEISGKDFGKQILNVIGQFMKQLGALMIAYAVQMALFAESSKNPYAWPVALAAGIGMVAAGAAISSFASKGLTGGASSYSPASSHSGYSGGQQSMALTVGGEFELRGDRLVAVVNNTERKNKMMR